MINHVRTLLLNLSGENRPVPTFPGEEYVPPAFTARAVPPALASVRRVLFGNSPDRAMMNYRLRQFMCLLHASELVEFVLAPDPRTTYLPFNDRLLRTVCRGPVVTQTFGAVKGFNILNSFTFADPSGRLKRQWKVKVLDGTTVQLDSFNDDGRTKTEVQTYSVVDGLSTPLALGESGLQYRFESGVGSVWLVDLLYRPAASLPGLVTQLEILLSDQSRDALFGSDPVEPYATFRNLWDRHDVPAYRLGGVILALAYRTEEG